MAFHTVTLPGNGSAHLPLADSSTIEPEPGKRLIVQTVDYLATNDPGRVWATVSRTQDIEDGFRDITVTQLANAVNHVAWWLESKIGCSTDFEVIAYLGTSDVRYAILCFAAIKCGYVVSLVVFENLCTAR
jgi:acyl-CoA synthetase (AMP-forming)/AMP-acid ligase II